MGRTALGYTLGVVTPGEDSTLTSHGASIFLYKIGSVIEGSTSATQAGVTAANTIFSISVDGSGDVTLTQFAQIDHPILSDPTPTQAPFDDQLATLANNLVTLTASATITDFDGDTATSSATVDLGGNVKFADDGPTITVAKGDDTGVVLTTHDALTIGAAFDTAVSTANFGGVFSIGSSSYGADGAGLYAGCRDAWRGLHPHQPWREHLPLQDRIRHRGLDVCDAGRRDGSEH